MSRTSVILAACLGVASAFSPASTIAPKAARASGLTLRMAGGGVTMAKPSKALETHTLADGRVVQVMADSKEISAAVVESVASIGAECIKTKGSFSLCIPGGSIVKALEKLDKSAMDFSKVHIFFANERIGEYKCYKGAMESFVDSCGVPHSNVHKVGDGEPGPVAADYERLMLASPGMVKSPAGLPVFDLVLLGTGEDGHVGSLHPKSDEVKATGQNRVVLPIDQGGKKSIAVSMDFINAADRVILGAAGTSRAIMVKEALSGSFEQWMNPAGLVKAGATTWFCDTESIAEFKK